MSRPKQCTIRDEVNGSRTKDFRVIRFWDHEVLKQVNVVKALSSRR